MTDPVTRLNAALEGRCRIDREIGEGGMATVYLADDLKHERKVALKVPCPLRLAAALLIASVAIGCQGDHPAVPAEHGSDLNEDEAATIPMAEREALVALHNNTDGNNWNLNVGWLVGSDPCSWIGVTCEGGRVTELNLDQNNLSGPIPAELGNLTALSVLNLGDNQLSGPIPAELGNLPALTFLGLLNNDLTGSIPAELGSPVALDELRIDRNQLSGPIPAELGNLTALSVLNLGDNQLSGPIPAELGNLTVRTTWTLTLTMTASYVASLWVPRHRKRSRQLRDPATTAARLRYAIPSAGTLVRHRWHRRGGARLRRPFRGGRRLEPRRGMAGVADSQVHKSRSL